MAIEDTTPVLIGAGQFTERVGEDGYQGLANYEIAAKAGENALADTGAGQPLAGHIDAIGAIRTFEDVSEQLGQPFGKSDNFPHSIARRLDIDPQYALLDDVGGQTPQTLIAEMGNRIAMGESAMALLAGAENMGTVAHLKRSGGNADWSETIDRPFENRLKGMKGVIDRPMVTHGLVAAPNIYALFETARRKRMGMSRDEYALQMGELFAPFTAVAAENHYSATPHTALSAEEIATSSGDNRWISTPYPIRMVARDKVNQGAAVLIASVAKARALGVAEEKWVYLHGHCALQERLPIERRDVGASTASQRAAQRAVERAALGVDDIGHFDFYSCFPIAVSNVAVDHFGMAADDPRGLTLTGGLPFFGGPGNNYSMHGIAEMVHRLRSDPGSYGFVAANGGFLSKYAVGIYSTTPVAWPDTDSSALQAEVDSLDAPASTDAPDGEAEIEAYTVAYGREGPAIATVLGRLRDSGARFFANNASKDTDTLRQMVESDPFDARIMVTAGERGNRFKVA